MNKNNLSLFIKISRPLYLLGSASQYLLGVGIAHYLGVTLNWAVVIFGVIWLLFLQLSAHYLYAFFDSPYDKETENDSMFSTDSGVIGKDEEKLSPEMVKIAAGTALSLTAAVTVWLYQLDVFNIGVILIMLLIFLGSFFFATPPIKLIHSGYGEFIASVIFGNLIPSFAFMLQAGFIHRLLIIITLPLTLLMLAMQIAGELPEYATDIKHNKRNVLVRLGWENGMWLHNIFTLMAFVFLGIAGFFGLPSAITFPALIPLPLGLIQIWYMRQIAQGVKPNWKMLTMNAVILFGSVSYLLTFSFWIR
jgi:1,4-dihydroxy-2-naphthoate octaprenyltransferase